MSDFFFTWLPPEAVTPDGCWPDLEALPPQNRGKEEEEEEEPFGTSEGQMKREGI